MIIKLTETAIGLSESDILACPLLGYISLRQKCYDEVIYQGLNSNIELNNPSDILNQLERNTY